MFATVLGMFAPVGKYKKFVSLVMGFVLLAVMLQPIARFGGGEIPITDWFHGIFPEATADDDWERTYIRWRDAYLRDAFEEQLTIQLTGLLNQNSFEVHSAEFTYDSDFSRITGVWVSVSRTEEESRRVPFIRIEPIQPRQADSSTCPIAQEVKSLISQFYNLSENHIHVTVVVT